MSQVKVVYVKNLKESVTEEKINEMFAVYGEIDRTKKIRDYAFIHYKDRDGAVKVCVSYTVGKLETTIF